MEDMGERTAGRERERGGSTEHEQRRGRQATQDQALAEPLGTVKEQHNRFS